ncbi:GTPase-activating protein, partial [Coemansia aciculifera]
AAAPAQEEEEEEAKSSGLGRSISLRYGGNSATIDERRRPSVTSSSAIQKSANRRSIMLTSFVPPVGMSGGPNSSSSTRSSNDSHKSGTEPIAPVAEIRLRPPVEAAAAAAAAAAAQPLPAKLALPRISESGNGPPAWVLEVQQRTQEIEEKEEEEEEEDLPLTEIDLSPANKPTAYVAPTRANTSIYRSLSASLGIGQQPKPDSGERQRSTSQTSTAAVTSPSPPSGGGLFAAVTSFFGSRTSTQASAAESAQLSAMARLSSSNEKPRLAFPGMRPSHSESPPAEATTDDESLQLLQQLEAQNAQILGDNKARVFAEPVDQKQKQPPVAEDESADWDFWGQLISDYEGVSRASPRKLARAVHAGIPAPIRGTVWQLMSGSRAESAVVGAVFRRLQQQSDDEMSAEQRAHEKLIRQDVART